MSDMLDKKDNNCVFGDNTAPKELEELVSLPLTMDGVQLTGGTLTAFAESYVNGRAQ